jgi:hypothetical protein
MTRSVALSNPADQQRVSLQFQVRTRVGADGRLFTGSHKIAQQWSAALRAHPCKPDGSISVSLSPRPYENRVRDFHPTCDLIQGRVHGVTDGSGESASFKQHPHALQGRPRLIASRADVSVLISLVPVFGTF